MTSIPFEHKYILIFDSNPKDIHLEDYFHQFNHDIVYYSDFTALGQKPLLPVALLVHCQLIDSAPDIMSTLYQDYPIPIIAISHQEDEALCVRMLESGADDFLVTPLLPRELHARISAINRRVQRSFQKSMEIEKEILHFTDWHLYPSSRQLFYKGKQEVFLSINEYDLLLTFVRQPQRVLGRELLLQVTNNSLFSSQDRRLDVQISRLRQKIELGSNTVELIKTIRKEGYLFTPRVTGSKIYEA